MLRIRVYWIDGNRPKTEFRGESWDVDVQHNHLIIHQQDGSTIYVERANIRYFITDSVEDED